MTKLGFHISFTELLSNLKKYHEKYNITSFQFFTKSPQRIIKSRFDEENIKQIKQYIKQNNLFVVIHSQYLLNLCRPYNTQPWSIYSIIEDLHYIEKLSVDPSKTGVIIHMGKNTINEKDEVAIQNFIDSIIHILNKVKKLKTNIIFETSCKSKNDLFNQIPNLANLYYKIPELYRNKIKFCIDTCHVFVSGYDIRSPTKFNNFIKLFDKEIGMDKVLVIHLNDSKTMLNGQKDHHEIIGNGYIFNNNKNGNINTLKPILNISKKYNIPLISETGSDIKTELDTINSI